MGFTDKTGKNRGYCKPHHKELLKNEVKKQSITEADLLPQSQIHLFAVFWVFHNEKLKRVVVTKPVWDLVVLKVNQRTATPPYCGNICEAISQNKTLHREHCPEFRRSTEVSFGSADQLLHSCSAV